jgi:hypothetical protein
MLAYAHPLDPALLGGFGPVVGAGVSTGPVRFGLRTLWSPPSMHGELDQARSQLWSSQVFLAFGK